MRYLVTGCAGFIGSRVCEMLLDAGHTVVGIDDLSGACGSQRLDRIHGPGFAWHEFDVRTWGFLIGDTRPDAVIHLAAMAGVRASVEAPGECLRNNVDGTLSVLEMCRQYSIQKLVLASTSSVYGNTNGPTAETADTTRPLSPYAASKVAAEAIAYSYHHLHGLDVSVVRPFTVYGPDGRPDMSVDRFIRAIDAGELITVYGDGTQTRDYTYVDDVARGIVAALRPVGFEAINLGAGAPVAVKDVVRMLAAILEKNPEWVSEPAHSADVPDTWADISKAMRLLDWSPEVGIREGLERAVERYRSNRQQP